LPTIGLRKGKTVILVDRNTRATIREENKKCNAGPVLDLHRAIELMINRGLYSGALDTDRQIGK
jgi:hypothetical protein